MRFEPGDVLVWSTVADEFWDVGDPDVVEPPRQDCAVKILSYAEAEGGVYVGETPHEAEDVLQLCAIERMDWDPSTNRWVPGVRCGVMLMCQDYATFVPSSLEHDLDYDDVGKVFDREGNDVTLARMAHGEGWDRGSA